MGFEKDSVLIRLLGEFVFRRSDWTVFDMRVDLPHLGPGSDAMNLHTQYSNPVVMVSSQGTTACGIGFTLGDGNDILCRAIEKLLDRFEGICLQDIIERKGGLFSLFADPPQLRWLAPNAGPVYMAGAAILNTLLDWAAKRTELPLWKALALEPTDSLLSILDIRNLDPFLSREAIKDELDSGAPSVLSRIDDLEKQGLPVYFTTWMGSSSAQLIEKIPEINLDTGITSFKLKIGPDAEQTLFRVEPLVKHLGSRFKFMVDANQTMSYSQALTSSHLLEELGVSWLEEPFAPDNVRLHSLLRGDLRRTGASLEIATGENCPNAHTAISFIQQGGCDRFQADSCRVLSFVDLIPITVGAKIGKVPLTPHAGGSGLDELVPHLQAFTLARVMVDTPIEDSLMEYVGFCSSVFQHPTVVRDGRARVPVDVGYLGGLSSSVANNLEGSGGITWVTL